jgi:hypothetical protein
MEDRTVAFFVIVLGGIIQATVAIAMIVANITPTKSILLAHYAWGQWGISLQVIGSIGLLLSLFVFAGAVMILRNRRVVLGSAIVIACSLLSLPFTLGGLILGMLFGLVGGLFGYVTTKPDYSG